MAIFNKLFGLLSYRQRFLTPAIAYILCTPYPAYVVLETSNFWIRQHEWQESGNRIQKEMNELLSSLSLYQEENVNRMIQVTGVERDTPEGLVESIDGHLKHLLPHNTEGQTTRYLLVDGFSELTEPSIHVVPMQEQWNTFQKQEKAFSIEKSEEEFQKITQLVRNQLLSLGYSYAIFQGNNPSTLSYASLVLEKLPYLIELIRRLEVQSKIFLSQTQENKSYSVQIIALHGLVKKVFQEVDDAFDEFYHVLREDERYTSKNLAEIKNAFSSFSQLTTNFIDQISEMKNILKTDTHDFSAVVLAKNALVNQLFLVQHPIFERELNHKTWFYYAFLAQFFFLLLVVWLLVKYRGLSIHLTALAEHINRLAKGQLSYSFTTHEKDEFGIIGKALDKVVDVIGIIVSDLVSFSKQIEEITVRVSWAVREQEATLLEQQKIIVEGKKSAEEISERARFLSNLLSEISESSQLTVQAEQAHNDLHKMRNNMNSLVKDSEAFLVNFDSFTALVQTTQKKVNFMDHLGDEAKMLSLNGKIENANIMKSAGNFSEITNKIERFSDNSEGATSKIKKIIKEALTGVQAVKSEAQRCLSEISAGVGQLTLVSKQLEGIAKLGDDQQRKFLKVDELMKVQATSSQNIIENVQKLLTPANENAVLVGQIPKILGDIIEQQKKLTAVIEKVRFTNESK